LIVSHAEAIAAIDRLEPQQNNDHDGLFDKTAAATREIMRSVAAIVSLRAFP
jgi:hypothetical protein